MTTTAKPLTVLMADDDEDDRSFIMKAWAEGGADSDLRFVEDGEQLTDYLNHRGRYSDPSSAPRPALMLLDLNMPRKDGRAALREIKANPDLRQIPIVVLTTSQAEEDICCSYDLGANSFITKPVTFKSLVNVLHVLEEYWTQVVDLPLEDFGARN